MGIRKIMFLTFIFITGTFFTISAQERFTLSGVVKASSSNENLIGVSIVVNSLSLGTTTNEYGYYALSLPAGDHKVWISYLGFSDKVVEITLDKNKKLDILLDEATEQLEEVVVSQNSELLNVRKPQMSVNVLNTKTIKQIPAVLGEADIVKSIVLLPGVSNAGEGSSGFNVRGGAVDQNLILLDEATIYNSSHLFGLFSIFNPDAIKDLKLYKGGIPSRYGGRVSSVLEIYQKEGNSKEFKGNGGIGAVASRLLLEGPIANEKSSFLIGGRASYAHLFLKATGNDNSCLLFMFKYKT